MLVKLIFCFGLIFASLVYPQAGLSLWKCRRCRDVRISGLYCGRVALTADAVLCICKYAKLVYANNKPMLASFSENFMSAS
jgi:hypothetical protein